MTFSKLFAAHLALALWAGLSACATAEPTMSERANYRGYEAPPHTVVMEDGDFELRTYDSYLVASTTVEREDFDAASNEGFRRLAGYIFGGNTRSGQVAMTVPVTAAVDTGETIAMTSPVNATREGKSWRISFMMPARWSLESLPAPRDERVFFEKVAAQSRAVVKFSWLTTDARVREQTRALVRWAEGRGLQIVGSPVVARYDDPFTLPWRRTNEIWLDVAPPTPDAPSSSK